MQPCSSATDCLDTYGNAQAVVDYIQLKPPAVPGGPEPEYRVAMTLQNASCLRLGLSLPDEPPESAHLFSISLISLPDFVAALEALNSTTPEPQGGCQGVVYPGSTDREVLADGVRAGCTALQCSVGRGTWLQVADLRPELRYLLIQAPGSLSDPRRASRAATRLYTVVQALTAGTTSRGPAPGMPVAMGLIVVSLDLSLLSSPPAVGLT